MIIGIVIVLIAFMVISAISLTTDALAKYKKQNGALRFAPELGQKGTNIGSAFDPINDSSSE